MVTRDAKKMAVPERWALGKLKKRAGWQDGRPDRRKTGGTMKTAVGNRQNPVWALPAVGWLKGETPDDSVLSMGRRMGGSELAPPELEQSGEAAPGGDGTWRVPVIAHSAI